MIKEIKIFEVHPVDPGQDLTDHLVAQRILNRCALSLYRRDIKPDFVRVKRELVVLGLLRLPYFGINLPDNSDVFIQPLSQQDPQKSY